MAFTIIQKESVLKKVDKVYKPLPMEKLFYQDINTKELFKRKPFLSTTSRDWNYYVIDTQKIHEYKGLQKHIETLDESIAITLLINFKFQLLPSVDLDFLRSVLLQEDAELSQLFIVETYLNTWIEEFVNTKSDFIKNFFKIQEELIEYIEQKALAIGITLEVIIRLKEDHQNDHQHISGEIAVRVKDYPGKVKLRYNVELDVIDDKKVEAILALSTSDHVQNEIGKSIRNTIGNHEALTLHTLYFELNTTVREIVENQLKKLLYLEGLEPVFLDLEVEIGAIPPLREQINYTVESITRNNHKVAIDHILILTLKDLGKYFSSGIKDIREWVKEELKRLTQDYIFYKEFTELVVDFDDHIIKEGIKEEIEKIGYEIKQLITIPDLQKIIPKYIEFETGENHEFSTKRDKLKVKLNVIVTGRVEDISKMTSFLNPNTTSDTVLQKMREAVLKVIRQDTHTTEPEDFYMRFEIVDPKTGISLSEKLAKKIKKQLKDDFGMSEAEIICKQLDTELVKQFTSIQGVSYPIIIESKSGEIKYEIPFDVISVHQDGWHTFKAKCDALRGRDTIEMLKEIARRIKNYVELELDNWKYGFVGAKNNEFKLYLADYLSKGVEAMKDEFGLNIKLTKGWKRFKTSIEITLEQQRLEQLDTDKKVRKLLEARKIEKAEALIEQDRLHRDEYIDDHEKVSEELNQLHKNHIKGRNIEDEIIKLEEGVQEASYLLKEKEQQNNDLEQDN